MVYNSILEGKRLVMLLDLPVEILSEILVLLDHRSILHSSAVSVLLSIPLVLSISAIKIGLQTPPHPRRHVSQSPIPHRARSRGAHRWASRWSSINDCRAHGPPPRATRSMASHASTPSSIRSASRALPRVRAGRRTVRQGDRGVRLGAQTGRIVVAEQHV
jgi:hypothetical protein